MGRRFCFSKYNLLLLHPLLAGVSALAAGIGAFLAMVVLVLAAFFFAKAANLDALLHHMLGVGRITCYKAGCQGADIGAVAVEHDAAHHHFYIVFLQAHRGAGLAGGNTLYQHVLQVVGYL